MFLSLTLRLPVSFPSLDGLWLKYYLLISSLTAGKVIFSGTLVIESGLVYMIGLVFGF